MALGANLISSWKLDESSGTRVDNFGSNDLTDNGTVTSETGLVYDTAATFVDSNSEYLSITDGSQTGLDMGTSDWSVEAWIKAGDVSGIPMIVSKMNNFGGGNPDGWFVDLLSGGEIHFGIRKNAVGEVTGDGSGSSVSTGDAGWNHVVVTFDRSGNAVRYLDGSATGNAIDISSLDGENINNIYEVRIGARDVSGGELFYDGAIDLVRIWNRALSSTEVTKLYNSGAGLTDRQLLYTPKTIMY